MEAAKEENRITEVNRKVMKTQHQQLIQLYHDKGIYNQPERANRKHIIGAWGETHYTSIEQMYEEVQKKII